MRYLFNTIYLLLALAPWLVAGAIKKRRRPSELIARYFGLTPFRKGSAPCLWLHAVSVGEVNLLAPLIERIERRHPSWQCVVSASTRAGFELAKKKYAPRLVFLCPLDFTWAVRRTLDRIRPEALLLAELELWPNMIAMANERGVRIGLINGRLSEASFRGYAKIGAIARSMLRRLSWIAAQDETYARRFRALGAPASSVLVTGSIKFDGAQTRRDNPATLKLSHLAGFIPSDRVFLAGSTQDPEERLALDAFRSLADDYSELKLVIVPRHPERFDEVAGMLAASGVRFQRRTRLEQEGVDPASRVLLVDTVGELAAWWGTSHIAFVGGSMGERGGQNMIEPAAYGAAVSFGPNTKNFRDIVERLLASSAAEVVADGPALAAFVRRCLEDPAWAHSLGRRAQALVTSQTGAADRTCDLVETLLPDNDPQQIRRAA